VFQAVENARKIGIEEDAVCVARIGPVLPLAPLRLDVTEAHKLAHLFRNRLSRNRCPLGESRQRRPAPAIPIGISSKAGENKKSRSTEPSIINRPCRNDGEAARMAAHKSSPPWHSNATMYPA
jgi:hypothetical protein